MHTRTILASVLAMALILSAAVSADMLIEVQVAPHTLLLGATQGLVTVHTDIPYGLVDEESVELNEVAAVLTFADDCGNLVAKFPEDLIKAPLAEPSAEMVLTGLTVDGEPFAGTNIVNVRIWQGGKN